MVDLRKMDPERHAALLERREKLRRRIRQEEQLYGLTELRDGLSGAGEPFEILYLGEAPDWTPEWVPAGYSRVAWELVRPAEETWFGDDLQLRRQAALAALRKCAEPAESLLFVYEGRGASFGMTCSVAERHLDLLLVPGISSLSPLWVTSPPKQWLIEVSADAVRVGRPPG